jgi:hypothetical protein
MPFQTIRLATDEDITRLEASARRFADRWGMPVHDCGAYASVMDAVARAATSRFPASHRLPGLWRRCARRALRHARADSIAYGYVGHGV